MNTGDIISLKVTGKAIMLCSYHAQIQEFSPGGPGKSDKKSSDVFFSPQLILQKSNGHFQRYLSFFKVPEGVQHFQGGGVQLFPGVSNCLFPKETHITCDFPGVSGPTVPPLDPHLRYGITIKVMCSTTMANLMLVNCVIASHVEVSSCQFWWKFYQELTETMVQFPEGMAVSTQGQHYAQ